MFIRRPTKWHLHKLFIAKSVKYSFLFGYVRFCKVGGENFDI